MSESEEDSAKIPTRVLRSRKRHRKQINEDFHINEHDEQGERDGGNEEGEEREKKNKTFYGQLIEEENSERETEEEEEEDDENNDSKDEDYVVKRPPKKRSQKQKSQSSLLISTAALGGSGKEIQTHGKTRGKKNALHGTPKKTRRKEVVDTVSDSYRKLEVEQQMKKLADFWSFIDSTTLIIE